MSLLPKGIPGTSFSRYLQQQQKKFYESQLPQVYDSYKGIFQDIEAELVAKDIQYEPDYPALRQRIKDVTGVKTVNFQYRGTLDGRIAQPYPGPAKEGSFWVVEYPGTIGGHAVSEGDLVVRLNQFASDWIIVETPDISPGLPEVSPVKEQKLKVLKPPATKAAPGPGKRKIVLED
jgi:hypothetical protein